jgi:hypothetical protein
MPIATSLDDMPTDARETMAKCSMFTVAGAVTVLNDSGGLGIRVLNSCLFALDAAAAREWFISYANNNPDVKMMVIDVAVFEVPPEMVMKAFQLQSYDIPRGLPN